MVAPYGRGKGAPRLRLRVFFSTSKYDIFKSMHSSHKFDHQITSFISPCIRSINSPTSNYEFQSRSRLAFTRGSCFQKTKKKANLVITANPSLLSLLSNYYYYIIILFYFNYITYLNKIIKMLKEKNSIL